jgi:hypothetical protein
MLQKILRAAKSAAASRRSLGPLKELMPSEARNHGSLRRGVRQEGVSGVSTPF